jgi:uncharacterized integral membrane protein
LTRAPRSAGTLLRRIVAAVILVPLAVVIIAFAVANRQKVTVSFDPFSSDLAASSVTRPLYQVIIAVLILGVVIGGVAAWLRQANWRRTARRLEREVHELRSEVASFRHNPDGAAGISQPGNPPERLQLRPPLR